MSTRNRRNYSRNMYNIEVLYTQSARRAEHMRAVRVTKWITKQIEWRKYVTNDYNNNSTVNSLSGWEIEWEIDRERERKHIKPSTLRQCDWMDMWIQRCPWLYAYLYCLSVCERYSFVYRNQVKREWAQQRHAQSHACMRDRYPNRRMCLCMLNYDKKRIINVSTLRWVLCVANSMCFSIAIWLYLLCRDEEI